MFVCVCFAVTESEVRETIACGARTREAVTRACRAGGDCGACHGMIRDLIEEEHGEPVSCRPLRDVRDESQPLIADLSKASRTRAA